MRSNNLTFEFTKLQLTMIIIYTHTNSLKCFIICYLKALNSNKTMFKHNKKYFTASCQVMN